MTEMKNKNLFIIVTSFFLISINLQAQNAIKKLTDYVNPFIGTGAVDGSSLSGSNFPGATVPFGMVQLSPDTRDAGSHPPGYDYNDNTIVGFSHTHLSGTGAQDLLDILVMPAIGGMGSESLKPNSLISGYSSHFSHEKESARPGYYQVNLQDYQINAELTATEHVGFHRYTFPKSDQSCILIDLFHSMTKNWDYFPCKIKAHVRIIDNQTIEGYRIITGWTQGYRKVYFRAEFSKPFSGYTLIENSYQYPNLSVLNGDAIKALLNFNTSKNEKILVKVGLSSVSNENARLNLNAEVSGWNFDQVVANADALWVTELQKITIEGTKEQKEIFYSGLYHAFIQPNNIADVNGDYPGTDMVVRNAPDKKHFSTFSLWDTYRAAHPLYTLVQSKLTANFINSMIRQSDTYGFLPMWQLWGLENYCMIGNHAIPVIVDAALKGIKGFDIEKAYDAIFRTATTDHTMFPALTWEKYGYIPEDINSQSVSITLEAAYDDWCVAQLAKKLGKSEDYERFMKRSAFYKNVYDSKTKFFRGKNKYGHWLEPFNPLKYGANGGQYGETNYSPYTEGNAWQYLFYVPQDVNGLIELLGGKDNFAAKLDTFFTLKNITSEKNVNASGLIGQYAHGNEPSQHVTYLYNYVGQPWKTQKLVAQIQNELYNNSFSGYAGNEDCGQMSAWYIFSAMGFYPVNPASGVYVIGSPTLKSAEIKLDNGEVFKVFVNNAMKDNIYIQSAKLNGKPYTKTYITQNDIESGGVLEFVMGKLPNTKWGIKAEDVPSNWGY
jgi:predicted alpha-1,2-mannosidase